MSPKRPAPLLPLLLLALLPAGCRSHDLPTLPVTLGPQGEDVAAARPPEEPRPAPAEPAAPVPAPAEPAPASVHWPEPVEIPPAMLPDGTLRATLDGDAIFAGVTVRGPATGADGEARFTLVSTVPVDLPDLIVAVVFTESPKDATVGGFRPRIVTRELPLPARSRRDVVVPAPAVSEGWVRGPWRVAPGVPEILTPRETGLAGTAFLGGTLECVELDMDVLGRDPHIAVGLAPAAGALQAPLPPLEAQLLLVRAGTLVWAGPWVRLPESADGEGGLRRLHWRLRDVNRPAGAAPYLRVREVRP